MKVPARISNFFWKIIDISSPDRLSLIAVFSLALSGNIGGSTELSSIYLSNSTWAILATTPILVIVFFTWRFGKQIDLSIFDEEEEEYDEDINTIDISDTDPDDSSGTGVKLDIPDHRNEIYITFSIEEHTISIPQCDPINFDGDRGLTFHSEISSAEFDILIEPEAEDQDGVEVPLTVKDKLTGRTIKKISVCS